MGKKSWGGGLLPTDAQPKEYVFSCCSSFPSLPLPSWHWLVQILVRKGLVAREMPVVSGVVTEGEGYTG